MRKFILLLSLLISKLILAQSLQLINYGSKLPNNSNACLVIKNNAKALKNTSLFPNYKSVTTVKLIGFNDNGISIDSIIELMKPLTEIKTLIFDKCDLTSLDKSFKNNLNLENIELINHCDIYENVLFPLFKDNAIKTIHIEAANSNIDTDSLNLLKHLNSFCISSNKDFVKSNKSMDMRITGIGNSSINYTISYFGDFYKNEKNTGAQKNKIKNAPTVSYSGLSKLDCIKQPLPGVKINDTVYSFNPSYPNSFTYQSGSIISIDKNAFTTLDGKPYNEAVNIFYREFRNPVEIMLSGIPMTNISDGKTQVFKSGGMYQINAFDKNNNPLQTKTDTAVKINFAMTDTSSSFQFYSLNNNGIWATTSSSITTIPNTSNTNSSNNQATEAIKAYFKYLRNRPRYMADTTLYNNRFYDNNYVYVYRKDNFYRFNDKSLKLDTVISKKYTRSKHNLKTKSMFKIKYYRQTKDKQIVFKIIPSQRYNIVPNYMSYLFNKTFLYSGNLTKEGFKKTFNKKLLCWDVRPTSTDNSIDLDIKTINKHEFLSGELIYLKKDKTFEVPKKAGKHLNARMYRALKHEERKFNAKPSRNRSTEGTRFSNMVYNNVNYATSLNINFEAYKSTLKKQTKDELQMSYAQFVKYAKPFGTFFSFFNNPFNDTSVVSVALLKSGLGVKNIDCYLHSGVMEDIYVNYHNHNDSLENQKATMLYTSINTSYPLEYSEKGFYGHYYIKHDNYIIRFYNNTMQVSKPKEVLTNKNSKDIILNYENQYNIKNLNSNEITKLILN